MPLFAAPKKSKILHRAKVVNAMLDVLSDAEDRVDVCGISNFSSALFYYESIKKAIMTAAKNNDIKQRYIIEITNENIPCCKELMEIAEEVRHSDEIEANFVVTEKEYLGSITLKEPDQRAIYSNVKEIVQQKQYIFDSLWSKSIHAEDKIEEIGKGIEAEFYKVITDNEKAKDLYIDLARSVKNEALLLFANSKTMIRADKLGIIDYLLEASTKKSAMIKIICPLTEENSEIVKRISEKAPNIEILNSVGSHSGLFIADRAKFMRFELKEPKAEDFSEAIGFIIYSNSKVGVDSSRLFFELFWNERVQYEKLIEFEQLKKADKMQKEFIDVAAHELRSPVQPILGLAEVLSSQIKDAQQQELLNVIIRNAKRLQQLTDDILDVSKIESQALKLKIEEFDLNSTICDCIQDARNTVEKASRSVKLLYQSKEDVILVEADKVRISQVISNLLSNAIKFTEEGIICVNTEKQDSQVWISVRDTGAGINSEIFPRLFTKFATKSFEGTGLGLFISKSVIEAHQGRIWAKNNSDGKGATFSFTLPI